MLTGYYIETTAKIENRLLPITNPFGFINIGVHSHLS